MRLSENRRFRVLLEMATHSQTMRRLELKVMFGFSLQMCCLDLGKELRFVI